MIDIEAVATAAAIIAVIVLEITFWAFFCGRRAALESTAQSED